MKRLVSAFAVIFLGLFCVGFQAHAAGPTVPQNVTSTSFTSSTIFLSWQASTDASSSVVGYKIFRNATTNLIATTSVANGNNNGLSYFDTGPLSASTTYLYYVSAFDAANATSGLSTALPVTTEATGTIPSNYQSFYSSMQSTIAGLQGSVSSSWIAAGGALYPVKYGWAGSSGNDNGGLSLLGGLQNNLQSIKQELSEYQTMGTSVFDVEIGYPLLDQNFYTFMGMPTSTVSQFVDLYSQLSSYVHNTLHAKLSIEDNPLLTASSLNGQAFTSTAAYEASLNFSTYQARRSAENILIAQDFQPDYLILQTEPDTEAGNVSNTAIAAWFNNPASDTQMIGTFASALNSASGISTSTMIGAGVGSWMPNWQQYIGSATSGFIGLAGSSALDFIDTHIYSSVPSLTEVSSSMQIAQLAHSAGKKVTMSEFWPNKSLLTNDIIPDYRARNTFSFFAPIDQQFLQLMAMVGNYGQFDFIEPGQNYLYASYLDYNSLPCIPFYPDTDPTGALNSACDNQITLLATQNGLQAVGNGQLDSTGLAYQSDIYTYSANPPILSNIVASPVMPSTATVSWMTNASATSNVYYGTSTSLGRTLSNGSLLTSHSIGLSGLASNTLYYYEVESTSSVTVNGLTTVRDATSSLQTFFTTSALVGYWPLDDGNLHGATTTSAVDDSGNNYDGTATSVTWLTNGEVGGAANFNGSSTDTSNISIDETGIFDTVATGTISAWVKWDGIVTSTAVIFTADSGGCKEPFLVGMQNGSFVIQNACGGATFSAKAPITNAANVWHNLVYTSSGSGNKLYIDGQQASATYVGGSASTSFFFADVATSTPLNYTIGQEYGYTLSTFDGAIDEVRVYNFPLSATQVQNLWNLYSTNPPVLSNIIASSVASSSATISWMTNASATSDLYYGTSTSLGHTFASSSQVTSHAFTLSSLASNTLYYYQVESTSSVTVNGSTTIRDATSSLQAFFTASDLVGYWPLDDGVLHGATTTLVAEDSGNNYTGTASSVVWIAGGQVSGAAKFNGAATDTSKIAVSQTGIFDDMTAGTVSAWVKWGGVASTTTAIFTADSGGCKQPFLIGMQTASFLVQNACGGPTFSAKAPIANASNTWHNLVYTSGISGNKLYIDGQPATTTYVGGSATTTFFFDDAATSTPLNYTIGQEYGYTPSTFDGSIDEVRIYDFALTPTQVQNLYNLYN